MVVSAARVAANRRNALKSTGPRTIEGKKRSRRNALKHGLCAEEVFPDKPVPMVTSPVLPGECSATFDTIKGELYEEFHPRTAAEYWMIDRIAEQMWRLMRANAMERQLVEEEALRMAAQRQMGASDVNQEDAAAIKPLTPAMVLVSLFSKDESHPMMRLVRYQQSANSIVLRMFSRLQALRKRPNEDLYSREDVAAFKYPGHSEHFRKTGWPDMSDRKSKPPGTVGQADRGTVGAPERTHFEQASDGSNPLWRAANAVSFPDLHSAPDGTKPTGEEKARAA
jgi:hypothetical protein